MQHQDKIYLRNFIFGNTKGHEFTPADVKRCCSYPSVHLKMNLNFNLHPLFLSSESLAVGYTCTTVYIHQDSYEHYPQINTYVNTCTSN